jgi:integrase
MRIKLTPAFVKDAAAEPGKDRSIYWDETLPGFGLQVMESGRRSYVCQYRVGRRTKRMAIDGVLDLSAARKRAKALLGDVARGSDPLDDRRKAERAAGDTVKAICEEYLEREGGMKRGADGRPTFAKGKLRTAKDRAATFERLVYPKLGSWPIEDVKRSDVVRLLDKIEAERGPVMADRTLAALRRVFTWHALRSDEFRSPIVRGMARTSAKERARDRILSDDELREIWLTAAASSTPFACLVRFILLTATRRNEAARMKRAELSGDDWLVPAERMKGKQEFLVPLSVAARDLIEAMPRLGKDYVFTIDGKRPVNGFGKAKAKLDSDVHARRLKQDPEAKAFPNWTLHDLRRTARSLMSRAGVSADIAERCLAHAIVGVRGTYDRHAYYEEKKAALEALSALIARIVEPAR